MLDVLTYAASKKYTDEALAGGGAQQGKSAYEIAVEKGFKGTEEEWLASLKGDQGPVGPDNVYVGEQTPPPTGSKVKINPKGRKVVIPEFNDQEINGEDGWTSKQIIDSLCPAFEKTAPVVTCNPVVGYPLSVKSHLVPQQSGSGDPSPENVRPFVPYERAELTRCGKNLFDIHAPNVGFGTEPVGDRIKFVNTSGWGREYYCSNKKYLAKSLQGMGMKIVRSPADGEIRLGFQLFDVNGINISKDTKLSECTYAEAYKCQLISYSITGEFRKLPTFPDNVAFIDFVLTVGAEKGTLYLENIILSGKDTPYTPYQGETYTAPLPAETYGGEVDWRGKNYQPTYDLYTEKSEFTYDPINSNSESKVWMFTMIRSYNDLKKAKCTILPYRANGRFVQSTETCFSLNADYKLIGYIRLRNELGVNTIPELKTFLAEKGYQMIVDVSKDELKPKVPITPSATPTAIPGVNTLYSNGGDTTVSGREDPVHTIKTLTERITALEAKQNETQAAILSSGSNV